MDKIKDKKILYVLKANSLKHLICKTNLGDLELNYSKDKDTYFFTLDSVNLPKEENDTLLKILGFE